MIYKEIAANSFLAKKLILKLTEKRHVVECSVCHKLVTLELIDDVLQTSCGHLEQCRECRDYQIEKIYRCMTCSVNLLNNVNEFCGPNCLRKQFTQKSSALCSVCNSHLQKECKTCKSTNNFKLVKNILKKKVFVLVRAQNTVTLGDNRPCSHYSICKYCQKNIARGHKGNSVCNNCRSTNKNILGNLPVNQSMTDSTVQNGNYNQLSRDSHQQPQYHSVPLFNITVTYDVYNVSSKTMFLSPPLSDKLENNPIIGACLRSLGDHENISTVLQNQPLLPSINHFSQSQNL